MSLPLLQRAERQGMKPRPAGRRYEPVRGLDSKQGLIKVGGQNREVIVIGLPGIDGHRVELRQLPKGHLRDAITVQQRDASFPPAHAAKLNLLPTDQVGDPGSQRPPFSALPGNSLHLRG